MEKLEDGSADCLGTRIAYRRRRGPGPSLLLIHGISDDGRCWEAFLPSLDPSWDLVMPDLRGHGLSADPDGSWTFLSLTDEVAALCRGLGLRRPFVAGVSLGGAIALMLAAYHPDAAAALFLEDPVPVWAQAPAGAREAASRGLAAWLEANKRKTESDLAAEFCGFSPPWEESERRAWIESKLRMSHKAIGIATEKDALPPDVVSAVSRVRCPVFLITAEPGRGAINREEDLASLAALVPGLECLRLPGAGHNVRRESPEAYREAFLSFFARFPRA